MSAPRAAELVQAQGIASARRNAGVLTSSVSGREDACKELPRACSSGLLSSSAAVPHGDPAVLQSLWTSGVRFFIAECRFGSDGFMLSPDSMLHCTLPESGSPLKLLCFHHEKQRLQNIDCIAQFWRAHTVERRMQVSCFFVYATPLGQDIAAIDPALIPQLHAHATGRVAEKAPSDLSYAELVQLAAGQNEHAVPLLADVVQAFTSLVEDSGLIHSSASRVRHTSRCVGAPRESPGAACRMPGAQGTARRCAGRVRQAQAY